MDSIALQMPLCPCSELALSRSPIPSLKKDAQAALCAHSVHEEQGKPNLPLTPAATQNLWAAGTSAVSQGI